MQKMSFLLHWCLGICVHADVRALSFRGALHTLILLSHPVYLLTAAKGTAK